MTRKLRLNVWPPSVLNAPKTSSKWSAGSWRVSYQMRASFLGRRRPVGAGPDRRRRRRDAGRGAAVVVVVDHVGQRVADWKVVCQVTP